MKTRSARTGRFVLVAALCLVASAVSPDRAAASVVFTITAGTEFSASGATFGGSIIVTYANNGAGVVRMTVNASGATSTNAGAKITEIWFNVDNPFGTSGQTPSTITGALVGASVGSATLSKTNLSGASRPATFKADGGGRSNLVLDLPPPGSNTFDFGETMVYDLTAPGLDENDFATALSQDNGTKPAYHVAMHIQSLAGGKSGFFKEGDNDAQAVPIPPTFALAIAGAIPLMGAWGLRRRKQAAK